MARQTGRVSWFNNALRMGLLSYEGGATVVCRFDAIRCNGYQTLIQGEAVEFDLVPGVNGLTAANVRRISQSSAREVRSGPMCAG